METTTSFKVSSNALSHTYHFNILQPISDTVIFFDKYGMQVNSNAVRLALVVLSEPVYQSFIEMERDKTCPANFLNENTKKYVVISDNPNVINALNTATKGTRMLLSGNYIQLYKVSDRLGLKLRLPPYNVNYIEVTNIKLY